VQKWQFGPFYPYGSVYALQWGLDINSCGSDPLAPLGTLFFNINIYSPEPDLGDLIGKCPQLGNVSEINTTNSSCSVVSSSGIGDPCAVTMDKTMVESISSAVQSLITASATTTSASATSTLSPTLHNIAVSSDVPLRYVVVAIFLASLRMVMFS
jgi:hypothetical protein